MNKSGKVFLDEVRKIIAECSMLESPERAARVTAFSILVMLDGSGEHDGEQYKLTDANNKPVKFWHHDL